jgi:predicted aldo/keto reductase-like oxidoreductase
MRALASPQQLEQVLEAALAAGINHLETAPAYGPSEHYLGRALTRLGVARDQVVITTKMLPGFGLAEGKQQLRQSLQRLGLERLDNLAVHGLNLPEHLAWATAGPGAELLAWAQGEGLVGQVGFSSHGSNELIAAALASGAFRFVSLHLHLFDQERLPLAQRALAKGLGVLAISPADKGGQLYAPPAQLSADCAPFQPLELAYLFLLAQGISSLTLGAAQATDLAWVGRLAQGDGPRAAAAPMGLNSSKGLSRPGAGPQWSAAGCCSGPAAAPAATAVR